MFLSDSADDAYSRLIDRLLSSPHFGERWARHWLDVVGYVDTVGFDIGENYLLLTDGKWRYRDYVIQSFNRDKPYDRFLMEQLAGDELPDLTADHLLATVYYRLGTWQDEPVDRKQELDIERIFGPQRAVIVESRDPLGFGYVPHALGVCDRFDEIEDVAFGRTLPPGRQWIGCRCQRW